MRLSTHCPRCGAWDRELIKPGVWRCSESWLDPGGLVNGPGGAPPYLGPPVLHLQPQWRTSSRVCHVDYDELPPDGKRVQDTLMVQYEAQWQRWEAWLEMCCQHLAAIEDAVARVVAVATALHNYGQRAELGVLLLGDLWQADRRGVHARPWDHDPVGVWFLRTGRATARPMTVGGYRRTFLGGTKYVKQTVRGWHFRNGGTGGQRSEVPSIPGTPTQIYLLTDGRRTVGGGFEDAGAYGFDFRALAEMAKLARLTPLPEPPSPLPHEHFD